MSKTRHGGCSTCRPLVEGEGSGDSSGHHSNVEKKVPKTR